MKKFILSEEEKNKIITLHRAAIMEQAQSETEGQVSLSFFENNKIYDEASETTVDTESGGTSGTSGGSGTSGTAGSAGTSGTAGTSGKGGTPKCPPITDTEITNQFKDDNVLLKYPNDKNYRYKKIGEDWFAKNINNKKVFNITKCGYTSSVEKLNKEFPSETGTTTPSETGTTTPSETGTTTPNTRGAEAAVQQYLDKKFSTTLPK